ncbi:glycosyltransferase family 4 protein [Streptomyces sp. NRRL S-87]|uniref:glycosyltransferase family 4 protein n=1 Tax=Streptomyces sp. NRRL S-87 TaxID=1463920 RepID=UPI0004C14379|nr:glycosyltransferase family 4 protein [Streptomyces sp. NRRL S-87]
MIRPLRIALIASARFPIREPFAGGLEAHTWALATALRRRGHRICLFAAPGSDPNLGVRELAVHTPHLSRAARADQSMTDPAALYEHHAYLRLMLDLAHGNGGPPYDLVHNNSLHYLPVAMAPAVPAPVVTTLHTPPTPWLESAIQTDPTGSGVYTAVSAHTARSWQPLVRSARVVHNGIDLRRWQAGTGGGDLVWSGRIVPEKGPDLAIAAAAELGLPLTLAGPVADAGYFRDRVAPRLGGAVRYAGHLARTELAALVGSARATLVTPCWDEPYGLVVAESLACGTPVVGFDRGALAEILTPDCGRLVPYPDVPALAAAVDETTRLSRRACRQRAEAFCSLSRMTDRYEALYEELLP